MTDFEILPMADCHCESVAAMEALCFSMPWSLNSVRGELNNPLSLWLVAVDGERVIGYVGSQTVLGETDLMNVAVLPEFRGRGVATALLTELFRLLARDGSETVLLEVRASNPAAISVYKKLGFREVGLRKNYYQKPREDAVIYRKDLIKC